VSNATQFSGSNTYIPSLESTGLVIQYIQDPKRFQLNEYTGLRKVDKDTGRYIFIDPDEAARVVNTQDFIWPDGDAADGADGNWNTGEHDFRTYRTERYRFPFSLGSKAVDQAAWDIIAQHAQAQANRMMVHRTLLVYNALSNASWGSHDASATALGGGKWDAGTSTNPYFFQGLVTAAEAILKDTNGMVRIEDLQLILTADDARKVAASAEIRDYMKGSPYALPVLEGKEFSAQWGLPPYYAGVKIIVETSIRVSSHKKAARSADFIFTPATSFLVGRPEGFGGQGAGTTFNTVTIFAYEDVTVETKYDPDNRRHVGRVVTDIVPVVTATATGHKVTAITS
jgi:hypothetical protein